VTSQSLTRLAAGCAVSHSDCCVMQSFRPVDSLQSLTDRLIVVDCTSDVISRTYNQRSQNVSVQCPARCRRPSVSLSVSTSRNFQRSVGRSSAPPCCAVSGPCCRRAAVLLLLLRRSVVSSRRSVHRKVLNAGSLPPPPPATSQPATPRGVRIPPTVHAAHSRHSSTCGSALSGATVSELSTVARHGLQFLFTKKTYLASNISASGDHVYS